MIKRQRPPLARLGLLVLKTCDSVGQTWSDCWDKVCSILLLPKSYFNCPDGPTCDIGYVYRALVDFVIGNGEFSMRSKRFLEAMARWSEGKMSLSPDSNHMLLKNVRRFKRSDAVWVRQEAIRNKQGCRDRLEVDGVIYLFRDMNDYHLEASIEDILAATHLCLLLFLRLRIWKIAQRTGEDEQSLLTHEPRPQDKTVGDPWCWPHNLVEGMGITGGRYFINLV